MYHCLCFLNQHKIGRCVPGLKGFFNIDSVHNMHVCIFVSVFVCVCVCVCVRVCVCACVRACVPLRLLITNGVI